jgi:hypothetical protein
LLKPQYEIKKSMKKHSLSLITILCAVLLTACGGGGGGGGGTSGSSSGSSSTQLSIATQPTAQSVTVGQSATFSVTASGTDPLTYQWHRGGSPISGATLSSYTTPATVIADDGSLYKVVITDGTGASITSTEVALTVISPSLSYLGISEVASCFYTNVTCWFEIYNPTSASINLSSYQVKASSINVSTTALGITTYTLPSFEVAAGAYVIVSGNVANLTQRGTQLVGIRSVDEIPYWTGSGFIELIKDGATIDFVRFGSSTQTPTTSSQWSGASVTALPYSDSSYGNSIVRLYPNNATIDTNTASDWSSVGWATPAGRNDVPVGAVDADGDGIPDSAEVSGGTYAGMDLYSMGARTGQKNIFIEVDYMNSADPGVIPRRESLQLVVDSFNAQSIKVHFDAGTTFGSTFSTTNFNLGQGSAVVAYEPCVTMDQTTCSLNTSSRRSIYDWKSEYKDLRRRNVFHYLLMGNSQLANGSAGSSGLAEFIGNDLLVTMGNWGFATTAGSPLNLLINQQASTLMHELGHNLGLRHGGNEDLNYKPNYWSIMNYMYQLNGLDQAPNASTAFQRWWKEKGGVTAERPTKPTLCSLPNSPCGSPSQFIMNFSDGSSSPLNEALLSEAANIGRGITGGSYADWNLNNSLTAGTVSKDLNGDSTNTILSDHNDWGNLNFPFVRSYQSQFGATNLSRSSRSEPPPLDAITNDLQRYIKEDPPSIKLLEEIRRTR